MKSSRLLVVLTAAIMLAGFGCSKAENKQNVIPDSDTSKVTTTPEVATSTPKAPVKPVAKPAVKAMTYEEALEKYRENGLMQFVDCHATPGTFTFKKGRTFMIDNRDNKTRTIVVQGVTYRLAAYKYAFVTPNKVGESFITCDGGGSATLRIQP